MEDFAPSFSAWDDYLATIEERILHQSKLNYTRLQHAEALRNSADIRKLMGRMTLIQERIEYLRMDSYTRERQIAQLKAAKATPLALYMRKNNAPNSGQAAVLHDVSAAYAPLSGWCNDLVSIQKRLVNKGKLLGIPIAYDEILSCLASQKSAISKLSPQFQVAMDSLISLNPAPLESVA